MGFGDDEGGDLEVGGDVAGAGVVADEVARFVDEGAQLFDGGEEGDDVGLKVLFFEKAYDGEKFGCRPIFFHLGAARVDGDPLWVSAVDEAGGGEEAIFWGGLDMEEGLQRGNDIIDHGPRGIADVVQALS